MRTPSSLNSTVGGGLGEHRLHGAPHDQADPSEAPGAFHERDRGDGLEIAAQHVGPADVSPRRPCGLRHRVEHHPRKRALAQLPHQERAQEPLLGLGRAREELPDRRAPRPLRSRPGEAADPLERTIHLRDRQRRCGGGRRHVAQRRPADPDLSLAELPGKVRDPRLRFGGRQPPERVGQRGDLPQSRRRGSHGGRRLGELLQQHPHMVLWIGSAAMPGHTIAVVREEDLAAP